MNVEIIRMGIYVILVLRLISQNNWIDIDLHLQGGIFNILNAVVGNS